MIAAVIALSGLAVITLYKIFVTGFKTGPGVAGLVGHLGHEWVILTNLLGLLVGFALLSKHFEDSKVPALLPRFLPGDWKGGFVLLAMIWVLSSFLDNIAAALIGGAVAHTVYRGKVHIGFLAAIVAASNAGGSMIWFGSSAGVALTNMFPEGKNALAWIKGGWHVIVAYVISYFFMLLVLEWHADAPLRGAIAALATVPGMGELLPGI